MVVNIMSGIRWPNGQSKTKCIRPTTDGSYKFQEFSKQLNLNNSYNQIILQQFFHIFK